MRITCISFDCTVYRHMIFFEQRYIFCTFRLILSLQPKYTCIFIAVLYTEIHENNSKILILLVFDVEIRFC